VQKYGVEKELTRHTSEENILKCTSTITENKAFENLCNPVDNNSLLLYDIPTSSKLEKELEIDLIARDITRTKNIVEKLMFNLYDLEKKGIQENSEKIELNIDLYQMEDY